MNIVKLITAIVLSISTYGLASEPLISSQLKPNFTITLDSVISDPTWTSQPSSKPGNRKFIKVETNTELLDEIEEATNTTTVEFSSNGELLFVMHDTKYKEITEDDTNKPKFSFKNLLLWGSITGITLFACRKIYDSYYKKKQKKEDSHQEATN